ncbi:hypothetical protein [Bacillus licheniformis]|uniref:hypothetical protein n=1 Tax=Bacillus licheniformis TaxID=1402 RepID=UPI0002E6A5DB|nr:hypothetical protein [Bacillus licheniformis]
MSIDLFLLCDKRINKTELERDLNALGFKEEEDNLYYWFNNDFLSTRGCYFNFRYDAKFENLETGELVTYPTLCSTITYAGRSHDDFQMQYNVLQLLKQKYGGTIKESPYDDEEINGIDNEIPKLSSTEIACGLAYSGFVESLHVVDYLIEDYDEKEIKTPTFYNKPLLRNNTLIPFCVTVFENFLKTFFERYLQTNEEAKNRIFDKRKNETLSYPTVEQLLTGEKTIIDLELEKYSFQNVKSANRAYKKFLDFDLFDVLGQRITYEEDQDVSLNEVLSELIETRHRIIHEAILDISLSKKIMKKYHFFLKSFGELFIKQLMNKHKLRLLINEIL